MDGRAAEDRPACVGYPAFGQWAHVLLENGYEPLPIVPRGKRPDIGRWTQVAIDPPLVAEWQRHMPYHGIGLRTGRLVGVDIDILDPDLAHKVEVLTRQRFGETQMRVGMWPKRLLLYRTAVPFAKRSAGKVEVLARGQQFVAFGIHERTGRPYDWPNGVTPLDAPISCLPSIDADAVDEFLAEVAALQPGSIERVHSRSRGRSPAGDGHPIRDGSGRVVDGRDGWLSRIAFHIVHDAVNAGEALVPDVLAKRTWDKFAATTDLMRPGKDGRVPYIPADALAKIGAKLRLHKDGLLPSRDVVPIVPQYQPPTLSVAKAREQLDSIICRFCDQAEGWQRQTVFEPPKLGIRATVGLGKSRISRRRLLELAARLKADGLRSRILVFTANHRLAEEAADGWREDGAKVAVLRGYERIDPVSREPMCRDPEAVRAAHASNLSAQKTVCTEKRGAKCRFFRTCLKQKNRRDVAAADVVIAPYDALFTAFSFSTDDIAVLLIDEACWPRALDEIRDVTIDDFAADTPAVPGAIVAGLLSLRRKAANGMFSNGVGEVRSEAIRAEGLTASDCKTAALLEEWGIVDPELHPDLTGEHRRRAFGVSAANARILKRIDIWHELAAMLEGTATTTPRLRIRSPDAEGRTRLDLRVIRPLHQSLRGRPVLYLDATLREGLAGRILSRLKVETIEAAAPDMRVRLVTGSFGKSMLCPDAHVAPEETQRRSNRLQECVDYVRWQALRHRPGRVLVVTYMAIETSFGDIPNVETLHFNAVAGLDTFGDVSCLITIGRPLPSSHELEALCGGYLGGVTATGYTTEAAGIHMRSGSVRNVRVIRHPDEAAETLRAAICDDELIQAIGRGRGVNRTADNPLEVHVLADVALPLVHDRLQAWDQACPDVVQRMLLAGVAVDSPADAAVLHPDLFSNAEQAKKLFERDAFKGQNPIENTYREMSLKSACYRRAGRGRSWQRAWWISEPERKVREFLESRMGPLQEWRSDRV